MLFRLLLRRVLTSAAVSWLLIFRFAPGSIVDQVAAVVEESVITFSEVRSLAKYRNLPVPESPEAQKSFYLELVNQLIDQRIIANEAIATPGIAVTQQEVDAQMQAYLRRFPTQEAFQQQLRQMEISEQGLRDLFRRQLAVNEFVEVRFTPFIIVLPDQIQAYYQEEFIPELMEQGQVIPSLELVEESIRQILTERRVNEELDRWLRSQRRKTRVRVLLYRTPEASPNLPDRFLDKLKISPVNPIKDLGADETPEPEIEP